MESTGPVLGDDTPLIAAADAISRAPHGQLPVLDAAGQYRSIVTARGVADALADGEHNDAQVRTVIEYRTPVRITDHVDDSLGALESAQAAVSVLDEGQTRLVGWLSHQRVLVAVYDASRSGTVVAPPESH